MKKYKVEVGIVECHSNYFIVNWSARGLGFGQVTLTTYADGSVHIDDEYMSKEFVKAVFDALIEKWYK